MSKPGNKARRNEQMATKARERAELRDRFAMAAMQAMITNGGYHQWMCISHDAYELADAMLAERNRVEE